MLVPYITELWGATLEDMFGVLGCRSVGSTYLGMMSDTWMSSLLGCPELASWRILGITRYPGRL